MTTLNDAKFNALRTFLYLGAINDMERDMLIEFLAIPPSEAPHNQDMWHLLWDTKNIPSGNFQDRAYEWLGALGYLAPHINERWRDFWLNETLPPPLVGPELITDPSFDAPGDWGTGLGWSVSGGLAICDGTQVGSTDLTNTGTLSAITTYRVAYNIQNYVAGSVASQAGTVDGTSKSSNGLLVENVVSTAAGSAFRLRADAAFVGEVTNFSVRAVI